VCTEAGFARHALIRSRSNLQKRHATIRLGRRFAGCQWLCCSPFAQNCPRTPKNLLTLRAYYQQQAHHDKHLGEESIGDRQIMSVFRTHQKAFPDASVGKTINSPLLTHKIAI